MEQPIKIPTVEALLNKHGEELIDALGKALPHTSDATGELRDSIYFTIKRFGITYSWKLHLADYYEYVDAGRPPGKFPWDKSKGLGDEGNVILQWMKNKRFVLDEDNKMQTKTKGSKFKSISDDLKLAKQIAYLIGRKIAKEGTKGNNFYTSTVPQWVENLKKEIPKALKRDVLIEVKEAVKEIKK